MSACKKLNHGKMRYCRWAVAEFNSEILPLRLKFVNNGCGGSKPNIQILQGIVIDQVELNIFIAAAFSRLRADSLQGNGLRRFGRFLGQTIGVCAQQAEN